MSHSGSAEKAIARLPVSVPVFRNRGRLLRGTRFPIGLRAVATFAVTLLVMSNWVASKEKALLNFNGRDGAAP